MSPYIHSQSVLKHSRVQRQTGCQSSLTSLTTLSAAFSIPPGWRLSSIQRLYPFLVFIERANAILQSSESKSRFTKITEHNVGLSRISKNHFTSFFLLWQWIRREIDIKDYYFIRKVYCFLTLSVFGNHYTVTWLIHWVQTYIQIS